MITEQEGAAPEETLLATGQVAMTIDWSSVISPFPQSVGEDLELWPLPGESSTPDVWQQSSQFYSIAADAAAPETPAQLVGFRVNSEQAVEILGLERGVPDSPAMRETLEGSRDENQQAEADHVEAVAEHDPAPRWIGPAGPTAIEDITPRIIDQLLHHGVSPEHAAEQWLTEARAVVSGRRRRRHRRAGPPDGRPPSAPGIRCPGGLRRARRRTRTSPPATGH